MVAGKLHNYIDQKKNYTTITQNFQDNIPIQNLKPCSNMSAFHSECIPIQSDMTLLTAEKH